MVGGGQALPARERKPERLAERYKEGRGLLKCQGKTLRAKGQRIRSLCKAIVLGRKKIPFQMSR